MASDIGIGAYRKKMQWMRDHVSNGHIHFFCSGGVVGAGSAYPWLMILDR